MNTNKVPFEQGGKVNTNRIRFTPGPSEPDLLSQRDVAFQLGEYFVRKTDERICSGGQAEVYPCHSTKDDKQYIAKVYFATTDHLTRIEEMNRVVRDIPCASLPDILEIGHLEDHRLMIVMKRYENVAAGMYNYELHGQEKKYRQRFLNLVSDLTNAMVHLVDTKIYHADIKPINIMQKRENGVLTNVLIDYGAALFFEQVMDADTEVRLNKSVPTDLFSTGYQAPELLFGKYNKANEYTDVYSMGISVAEYVAGVYPKIADLSKEESAPEQKEYYKRNKGKGRIVQGILLPEGFPKDLERFFEGTLFSDVNNPEKQRERWSLQEINAWLRFERDGRYQEAAAMRVGASQEQARTAQTGSNIPGDALSRPIYISYSGERVAIRTVEEMVDAFLEHWTETLGKVMTQTTFPTTFDRLGGDVVEAIRQAGERMKKEPLKSQEIFESDVITLFGSQEVKNQLIYRGMRFRNAKELGTYLYATLVVANQKKVLHHIVTYGVARKDKMDDDFTKVMFLFEDGKLSQFLSEGHPGFEVDAKAIECAKVWEDRMNGGQPNKEQNKVQDLVKLYQLSFYLQGVSTYTLEGRIYTDFSALAGKLRQDMRNKDITRAYARKNKMYAADKKMRFDFFAWMQMAEGVVPDKRPGLDALSMSY